MALVRFMSPRDPNLELPGVPATFVGGIADIDDSNVGRLSRMAYLGYPYGVVRMSGIVDNVSADIASILSRIANLEMLGGGVISVVHGANVNLTRPATDSAVIWFGEVNPTNADPIKDVWIPAFSGDSAEASARDITVVHGSDAARVRPLTVGAVVWYGTVKPTNIIDGDVYMPVSIDS